MTTADKTYVSPPFRVLVVDDNQDQADTLSLLLRMEGFDVQTVYDGEQALQAAHDHRPNCILADIGLPGMDGYRLAELLRQEESLSNITLIAITAYADAARAKAAGFDHHFVKPADPAIVEGIVRRLRTMGKRLEIAEELVQKQGEVVTEARDLMKEVKDGMQGVKEGMQEMKQELREVKEDVKEIKEELQEVKETKGS
jgi:CheY-like chemotaxis protein